MRDTAFKKDSWPAILDKQSPKLSELVANTWFRTLAHKISINEQEGAQPTAAELILYLESKGNLGCLQLLQAVSVTHHYNTSIFLQLLLRMKDLGTSLLKVQESCRKFSLYLYKPTNRQLTKNVFAVERGKEEIQRKPKLLIQPLQGLQLYQARLCVCCRSNSPFGLLTDLNVFLVFLQ